MDFINTQVRDEVLKLIEEKVCGNKKQTGRPGMDLWQILVLGVVRLALDCDYGAPRSAYFASG